MSDLHLGHRAFLQVLAPDGGSLHEQDVAASFHRAIDKVITLAPDLVVVAGDVFDSPKPTNRAISAAVMGFARLARALPETPVVVCSGNHDLSCEPDIGAIVPALSAVGVHVADRRAQRFYFPRLDVSVLAVPDAPGTSRPALEPDRRASRNILLLHGEVRGMLPAWVSASRAAIEITSEELASDRWDYVALGHYHVHTELAANVAYSGSLDFTSSNPWEEIATPKGIVERDLEMGISTFHPLPVSREYIDLPAIDAEGLGSEALREAIDRVVASRDVAGSVVRLIVHNAPVSVYRGLGGRWIGGLKKRATYFKFDVRQPDAPSRMSRLAAVGGPTFERDLHEEALMADEAREWWGDDDASLPGNAAAPEGEYDDSVRRILMGEGRSLPSMLDPYGLDADLVTSLNTSVLRSA